jgi:hypothetical protein
LQPNSPSKPQYVAEIFQMQHTKTHITDPDILADFSHVKYNAYHSLQNNFITHYTHISTFPKDKTTLENTSETFHQNVCNVCITAFSNTNYIHTNNHFPLNDRNSDIKKFFAKQYKDTSTRQCLPLKKTIYTKCQFLTQNSNTITFQFYSCLGIKTK